MKPDVMTAMRDLIQEARKKIPFHLSFSGDCEGRCDECPQRLLEFLDIDLLDWEAKLKRGERPTLGDLHRLGRDCKLTYDIMQKRGLVQNYA